MLVSNGLLTPAIEHLMHNSFIGASNSQHYWRSLKKNSLLNNSKIKNDQQN